MKISNLERVNQLVTIKERCVVALDHMNEYLEEAKSHNDAGSTIGYTQGYRAAFHSYSDGSGKGADLYGCYVGVQAAVAIIGVLQTQITNIDRDLRRLDIDPTS